MTFPLLFAAEAPTISMGLYTPLSVMMFLEFAAWGAWFVVLGQYLNTLNFSGKQIGNIYSTMALGTILSPMVAGTIVDKYLNAEIMLGILHLTGALLLVVMAYTRQAVPFYFTALGYAIVYGPTIAVTRTIMNTQLTNAHLEINDFAPTIRVWGTIGWIVGNLALKLFLKPGQAVNNSPLLLAAGLSAVLGFFSFTLPATPPPGGGDLLPFLKAFELFNQQEFAVFFVTTFLISIGLAFYYGFTSLYLEQRVKVRSDLVGPLMTIGQWTEIGFMLAMPIMAKYVGIKGVMGIGIAAWVIRYGIFSFGKGFPLIVLGLALHGICYDFFFEAAFNFLGSNVGAEIQGSAMALFATLTYGLGMYLGNVISGYVYDLCTSASETEKGPDGEPVRVTNWSKFWSYPLVAVVVLLAVFWTMFHIPEKTIRPSAPSLEKPAATVSEKPAEDTKPEAVPAEEKAEKK